MCGVGLLPETGGHYMTPTQTSCTIVREIPQNYHTFALFDPSKKWGNLRTPVENGAHFEKEII